MAERDFYNVNDFIAYPLMYGDDFSFVSSGALPQKGLVDAGFMFGLDSQFDISQHTVTLFAVTIGGSGDIIFDFRSDAPGLAGFRWLFDFPAGATDGCVSYVDATPTPSGTPEPDRGWAFLTLGDPTDLLALGAGTYLLNAPPRIEPALLQSLVDTYVRTLNLADDKRACPAACCASSSSSSSSSSSGGQEAFIAAIGLMGDVKFKEGYNSRITVDTVLNSIDFDAEIGVGAGVTCDDMVIDEGGIRVDNCQNCDGLIKSINGVQSPSGLLRLNGGSGVLFVRDPLNAHKIIGTINVSKDCFSSSSSSSG